MRFKELLKQYYPWDYSENEEDKIRILYDIIRNPLAHCLGVLEKGSIPSSINRLDPSLTRDQIEQLERSPNRRISSVEFFRMNNHRPLQLISFFLIRDR